MSQWFVTTSPPFSRSLSSSHAAIGVAFYVAPRNVADPKTCLYAAYGLFVVGPNHHFCTPLSRKEASIDVPVVVDR